MGHGQEKYSHVVSIRLSSSGSRRRIAAALLVTLVSTIMFCHAELSTMPEDADFDEQCREYCRKALYECPPAIFEFSSYSECIELCTAEVRWSSSDPTVSVPVGDSLECRIYHINLGFTFGNTEWHCRHGRLDANVQSDGRCPSGCPCKAGCSYDSADGLPECIAGVEEPLSDTGTSPCSDFLLTAARHLEGPNGEPFNPATSTQPYPYDAFAESILSGRHGGCEAFRRYSNNGCFCEVERMGGIELRVLPETARLARTLGVGMAPALCELSGMFDQCPEADPAARSVDIGQCWTAVNLLAICGFGTRTQSCCAAIRELDALGCFCDDVFPAVAELDPGLTSLRDTLYPSCIPSDAQFSNTVGCPEPQFTTAGCSGEPWNRLLDSETQRARMATIEAVAEISRRFKYDFQYDATFNAFAKVADPNAQLLLYGLGSYTGVEAFVEYLTVGFPDSNEGLLDLNINYASDWTIQGDVIGSRLSSLNYFYNGDVATTLTFVNEYKFEPCSGKLLELRVWAEDEFLHWLTLAVKVPEYGPYYGPERYCELVLEYCGDPAVHEFDSYEECVQFQRALPLTSCEGGTQHLLEGNSSGCKYRHTYMLPIRPEHHCPHVGTGHVADDTGHRVCTQSDCAVPYKTLRFMSETRRPPPLPAASDVCNLTPTSRFLRHFASLADSPCSPPPDVLHQLYRAPPTDASVRALRKWCDPEGCDVLRQSLHVELDRFRASCPGELPGPASALPSPRAILRAVSDLVAHSRLVCKAESYAVAELLCPACPPALLPALRAWASRRSPASLASQPASSSESAVPLLCRQRVHLACANSFAGNASKAPGFCAVCFPSIAGHASSPGTPLSAEEEAACGAALEAFFVRDGCVEEKAKILDTPPDPVVAASWYEPDPPEYSSPFPGDDPPSDTTDHDLDSNKTFDFIVVGAGTSGCVVARRLSDAGYSVLVLEGGVDWQKNEDLWEQSRGRRTVARTWGTPAVRAFDSMPNPAMLNRTLRVLAGHTLGGSSTPSSNVYSRPDPAEFDELWPEGWGADEMTPFFEAFEDYRGVEPEGPDRYGQGGPVPITPATEQSLAEEWLEAAEQAGVPVSGTGAGGQVEGLYKVSTTARRGRNSDAFSAYLQPIMPRDGLEVRSGAKVARILLEDDKEGRGKRATGVVYILQGLVRVSAYASREVILCGGWMGSPKVLLLSGVGPREQLEDLEIDVEVELDGVGKQLAGRPMQPLLFGGQGVPPEMLPHVFTSESAKWEWQTNGTGILDTPIVGVHGRAHASTPSGETVNFLMSFSNVVPTQGNSLPLQTLLGVCEVCRPHSEGRLELRSPNPDDDLDVHLELLSDERDVDAMLACVKRQLAVFSHFAFQGLDLAGLHSMSDEQLRAHIKAAGDFSWHASGTCRMGDGPLDVVDSTSLRVRGLTNVRVADGSVFPAMPCSGPLSATYAVAEKAAAAILSEMPEELYPGKHVLEQQSAARGLGMAVVVGLAGLCGVLLLWTLMRCRIIRQDFNDHMTGKTVSDAVNDPPATSEAGPEEAHDAEAAEGEGTTFVFGRVQSQRELQRKASNGEFRRKRSSVLTQRRRSTVLSFHTWVNNYDSQSSFRTAVMSPKVAKRVHPQAEDEEEGTNAGAEASIFDRNFRRQSLLDAFTASSILSDTFLSIYFSDLCCRAGGSKKGEGSRLIAGVSGKIESGKLTILMGSSGSGKTTLLHQLAQRSTGVQVEGQMLYKLQSSEGYRGTSPARTAVRNFMQRNIAFLRQEANDLPPQLTVYETMVYYFTLMVSPQLVSSTEGIKSIFDTLEFIGLQDHAHKQVHQLSGGQKRRLQIGVRLLDCPLALFLDEPDAGLDGTTALKIMVLLLQITEKYGLTIVCSLHRPRVEVMQIAHSIYLMQGGAGVFQGSYDELRLVLNRIDRRDFQDGSCPVDYFLDYASIDQELMQQVYEHHIEVVNLTVIPELKEMAEAQDPNESVPPPRLQRGSLLLCSTTLFSAFTLLVGAPRRWREMLSDIAAKYATGFTLIFIAIMFQLFLERFLPVMSTSDIAVLHGALLIWGSCTLTIFQVCVAEGMVEVEAKLFFQLMQEALVSPLHVVVFWVARSFLIVCSCLFGFVLFYVGLGWQSAHGFNAGLVWFLFTLQNCMAAHLFQVAFGKSLSPVLYGLWSAVQILFCGVTVPLQRVHSTWKFIQAFNPQYYCFSTMMSLEIAVGRHSECGEYCIELLEGIYFERVDLLVTVCVMLAFLFGWLLLLYISMSSICSYLRNSGQMQAVPREQYGAEPMRPDLNAALIRPPRANEVNIRRLLKPVLKRRRLQSAEALANDEVMRRVSEEIPGASTGSAEGSPVTGRPARIRRLGLLAARETPTGAETVRGIPRLLRRPSPSATNGAAGGAGVGLGEVPRSGCGHDSGGRVAELPGVAHPIGQPELVFDSRANSGTTGAS